MPIRQIQIPEELSPDVLKHLNRLDLASVKKYRQWCVDNGFSRGLHKNQANRLAELAAAQRNKHSSTSDFQTLCQRQPIQALLAVSEGHVNPSDIRSPGLLAFSDAISAATSTNNEPYLNRQALTRAIKQLIKCRAKFIGSDVAKRLSSSSTGDTLRALIRIVQFSHRWVRPLDQWRPKSKSPRRQFQSLLHHLFARYESMPAFFNQVWTSDDTSMGRYRLWYIRVAGGENLRKCHLPISYTRKMAHWFMRAPDDFSIAQAVRFGQVMGLGGDQRIAQTIATTRLADNFSCDDFWLTVIRWFIKQPLLDPAQIGPIIDYINFQRFVPEHQMVRLVGQEDHADQAFGARQPNFSMRGRTVTTLLRQVNRWHQRLANSNRHQVQAWPASGIADFSLIEGGKSSDGKAESQDLDENVKHWVIRELLSTQSLVIEGRQLNHCVSCYAGSCSRRLSSIWTMELERLSGIKKLLTIEVRIRTRTIVQVRGKNNRLANEIERKIIRRWATKADLKVGNL